MSPLFIIKIDKLSQHIEAQFTLKQLVDTQIKDNIKNTTEKIIREGGANSTTFWKIRIYQEEKTPHQWQEGEIIRIYQGKGDKGKYSNEKGITLSSNMGKLFERLINNIIKHKVTLTEAQTGGQHGKATSVHINFLKSIINHSKATKKNLHRLPGCNQSI
jgi:hypothetical protein